MFLPAVPLSLARRSGARSAGLTAPSDLHGSEARQQLAKRYCVAASRGGRCAQSAGLTVSCFWCEIVARQFAMPCVAAACKGMRVCVARERAARAALAHLEEVRGSCNSREDLALGQLKIPDQTVLPKARCRRWASSISREGELLPPAPGVAAGCL